MIINGKEIEQPKLTFTALCKLEEMGINIDGFDKAQFKTIAGFVAVALNCTYKKALEELDAHFENGGDMETLAKDIESMIENSGFFKNLRKEAK